MPITKKEIVDTLEKRYDYQSARHVLEDALDGSGLPDKDAYKADEVAELCAELRDTRVRIDAVIARLEDLMSTPAAKAKPAAGKAQAKSTNGKAGKTTKAPSKTSKASASAKSSSKAKKTKGAGKAADKKKSAAKKK